jgi:hypothetical protein
MGALILVVVLPCSSAMACSIAAQSPRESVHSARLAVWVEVLHVDQFGATPNGSPRWEATVRRLRTFEAGRRVGLLLARSGPQFEIGSGSTISLADRQRARA